MNSMARPDCMRDCPRIAFCEYAAWKCGSRAVELYNDLVQTRDALGGIDHFADQPTFGSEQDRELQEITVAEVENNAFAAILLTDVEIMFNAEERYALESCTSGPSREVSGTIVCLSSWPNARNYSTEDYSQDLRKFETGL